MPGLHKHCHCRLECTEEVDTGWISTAQLGQVGGVHNIDGSISHDPEPPGPSTSARKTARKPKAPKT